MGKKLQRKEDSQMKEDFRKKEDSQKKRILRKRGYSVEREFSEEKEFSDGRVFSDKRVFSVKKDLLMKKHIFITVMLSLFIMITGFIGFSLLYDASFHMEAVVNEQKALPEAIGTAQAQFMEALKYPFTEETQALTEEETEAYLADSNFMIYNEGLERMEASKEAMNGGIQSGKGLVKLLSCMTGFGDSAGSACEPGHGSSFSRVTDESDYYIFHTEAEVEGEVCPIDIAIHNYFPVSITYRSQTAPSSQEMVRTWEVLEELAETQWEYLYCRLWEIDHIYEGIAMYQKQINYLYFTLLAEQGKAERSALSTTEFKSVKADIEDQNEEMKGGFTLADCCELGTWQVYLDEKEAALVCDMKQSSLILYYDAVKQRFCGFRLVFA